MLQAMMGTEITLPVCYELSEKRVKFSGTEPDVSGVGMTVCKRHINSGEWIKEKDKLYQEMDGFSKLQKYRKEEKFV